VSAEIIHGDCIDVLRGMADNSVGAVIADPPYNCGLAYASHDDAMPAEAYEAWCAEWFAECRRVAKRVVIFPGHGNLPMWYRIGPRAGLGCWFKPGNPAGGGVFQFCEFEPFLLYGGSMALSNVIRATITKQRDTGDHPCPKPLALLSEIVKRLRRKKDALSVLDPFVGSGTTGVACALLGVPFIGIEKDAGYAEIARRRIADAQAQPSLGVVA
jgi:site-specific DNA-methyltransferase (adenine-specific)